MAVQNRAGFAVHGTAVLRSRSHNVPFISRRSPAGERKAGPVRSSFRRARSRPLKSRVTTSVVWPTSSSVITASPRTATAVDVETPLVATGPVGTLPTKAWVDVRQTQVVPWPKVKRESPSTENANVLPQAAIGAGAKVKRAVAEPIGFRTIPEGSIVPTSGAPSGAETRKFAGPLDAACSAPEPS